MTLLEAMLDHARAEVPNEACGLVVACNGKPRILRARNISSVPRSTFDLDPDAWLEVRDNEEVIGIYHSHPHTSAKPSVADRVGCEATKLPWHIVQPETEEYQIVWPEGFEAPLLGRTYVHGILDCYAAVRDWYQREWNLALPNFHRDWEWWDNGQNLYVDLFADCGFVDVTGEPMRRGDAVLVQYSSPVPNHAAVLLGDGTIFHHPQGRLSTIDAYGGVWSRLTTHHLRHKSHG